MRGHVSPRLLYADDYSGGNVCTYGSQVLLTTTFDFHKGKFEKKKVLRTPLVKLATTTVGVTRHQLLWWSMGVLQEENRWQNRYNQ